MPSAYIKAFISKTTFILPINSVDVKLYYYSPEVASPMYQIFTIPAIFAQLSLSDIVLWVFFRVYYTSHKPHNPT